MAARKRAPRKRAATADDGGDDVELANLDLPAGFTTLSPTEERRERELEEILDELGSDARIKVWQIIDGKASYAGDMSASGFTLDVLIEAYGGGDKSLTIMQGKTKIDTVRVSLDPSIPARNPRTPKGMTAAAPNSTGDIVGVFAALAQAQAQSSQMMVSMMGGIITAMTTVVTATKPTSDPMDTALRVAEVLGKKPDGGTSVTEAMAMFREGMRLGERYGGGDEDDGVMSVVGKGMDTLQTLVAGMVESKKAENARGGAALPPGADVTPPVATNGAPSMPPSPTPPPVVSRAWVNAVRPYIGQLLAASKFMPASAAAETINKNLDDDQFSDLIDDIQNQEDGGFVARLQVYFPVIKTVDPEWTGEVLRILLTDYVEEAPDESDVAPAPVVKDGTP